MITISYDILFAILLIVTEQCHIVVDNNGDHRASAPQDQRPLLLIMERPVSDD